MQDRSPLAIAQRAIEWGFDILRDNSGLRYLATGAALFLLDLGVYVVLHLGFGVSIMTSQLASRTTGAVVGFVAHKFISFGASGEKQAYSAAGQGMAYSVVMGANILISPVLVAFMVTLLGGHAVLGKVASDGIIIAETYILLRFIFRTHNGEPGEPTSDPAPTEPLPPVRDPGT